MAKKILVVDDDPHIVRYLVTLFGDQGYDTSSAGNGQEGFETLEREKPDLVTLDLDMADEWGPKMYRRMIKDPRFKELPVVVISGLSGAHLAIKKAVATLAKPFNPDELMDVVRRAIGPGQPDK